MTPSELLFEQPLGKQGRPLFESQTDLVRQITEDERSDWSGKNFKSVRAFVNQVINGERKLSPSLRDAIFLVLPNRMGEEVEKEPLCQQIERTFLEYFKEKKELKKSDARQAASRDAVDANDFYLLEKRGLLADSVFISTRQPEVLNNNNWAREIKLQLLGKLGVYKLDGAKLARYTYFFPQPDGFEDMAFHFWKGLFAFMKYEQKIESTEEVLHRLNTGEDAQLKIYQAPPLYCSYPIIVYDLDTRAEVGFTVFDYVDQGMDRISTARISPGFLQWWKEDVHSLLSGRKPGVEVKEVTFDSIRKDLQKDEVMLNR